MKFTDIFKPFVFIFTHIDDLFLALPKVFKIADDVEKIAPTAITEAVQVMQAVGDLAKASVKDSGSTLSAIESFVALAEKCVAEKGLNLVDDKAAYGELLSIIQLIGNNNTWADVSSALVNVTSSFEKFGTTVQDALKQIEADAKS